MKLSKNQIVTMTEKHKLKQFWYLNVFYICLNLRSVLGFFNSVIFLKGSIVHGNNAMKQTVVFWTLSL